MDALKIIFAAVLKSFIYIILSTVLIFSILAPSVINLCSETEAIVLLETSEEEKSEKAEKELEEKVLNLYSLNKKLSFYLKKKAANPFYLDSNTDHTLKVLVPPPKHTL